MRGGCSGTGRNGLGVVPPPVRRRFADPRHVKLSARRSWDIVVARRTMSAVCNSAAVGIQAESDMASKKKAERPKPAKTRTNVIPHASLSNVVGQNLINMAIVIGSSGSVLLGLLIAKRFT